MLALCRGDFTETGTKLTIVSSHHENDYGYVFKRPIRYLGIYYSSKSTCLNDCYFHGAIKKLRTLVINFQSIHNKIKEIEVTFDSMNVDVIIGKE